MERSRKLTLTDWTKANDALNLHFEGNKSRLAETHLKMSRTTVTAFFKGDPIREAEFRKICFALRLNWQEVSAVSTTTKTASNKDDLVEQVRSHCRQTILDNYSEIRLLSGKNIGVDQLYVDVWLLDRSPRTFQVSQNKMLETFDLRNDRLGLGDRMKRDTGIKFANAESKLLILGKPGAGKTTFLKHLAVDWCNGKFQPNLIAVFIELRKIRDDRWKFLTAIGNELDLQDPQQIEDLLKERKLMVLMDGFDEVPTAELRRNVLQQIEDMVRSYPKNRFILTCRTQTMDSISGFACVEVADFNDQQVGKFVQNWFRADIQNSATITPHLETFKSSIAKNLALKELTVTPVLLGLMCLVLQDEGEIPAPASLLYERGTKLLLRKWNEAKTIDGWEMGTAVYRQLDVEQKETLLMQIAAKKFENPQNFVLFNEVDLIEQIVEILNLPSRADGKATLKAIEAQHGLLIERADELWSFSHLTFQEYFTTKWLLNLPSEELIQKVTDLQWQKVVQKLVQAQGQSDRLLSLIKRAIDQMLRQDLSLQKFLSWLNRKARSVQGKYRDAAIRAFFLYFVLDLYLSHNRVCDLDLTRDLDSTFAPSHAQKYVQNLNSALNIVLDRALAVDNDRNLYNARNLDQRLDQACGQASDFILALDLDSVWTENLKDLRKKLPKPDNWENFDQWWQNHGQAWIEELRKVTIDHRNIGHTWQFNEEQRQQLKRYYDANKFLVELLKIENAVTSKVRQEIEDNLLLPMAELQRRLPDQYS